MPDGNNTMWNSRKSLQPTTTHYYHYYYYYYNYYYVSKRLGIRIQEMCLTVNNILEYSIDFCRSYLSRT